VKVLITGGCGRCGTALTKLTYEKVFLDCRPCVKELSDENFIQGDVKDPLVLRKALLGCDVIIHLAAIKSHQKCSWQDVITNVECTRNILSTAQELGVERIIYASSNHVVGMYEIKNTPHIYENGKRFPIDQHTSVRPDSFYALSKTYCENLGRFVADNGGPKFYVIRIGTLLPEGEENPLNYIREKVEKGLFAYNSQEHYFCIKRLQAKWFSRRDFHHMVDRLCTYEGPRFDIFFGVSDNPNRWLDIEYAKKVLNYCPQDNSEKWFQSHNLTITPRALSCQK